MSSESQVEDEEKFKVKEGKNIKIKEKINKNSAL